MKSFTLIKRISIVQGSDEELHTTPEPIEGFMQSENMLRFMRIKKALGLRHMNNPFQRTIEEGIAYIQFHIISKGQDKTKSHRLNNWVLCLMKIDVRGSGEPFSHQACFVAKYRPISNSFDLDDPLIANQIMVRVRRYKIPSKITREGLEFLCHYLIPNRYRSSISRLRWFSGGPVNGSARLSNAAKELFGFRNPSLTTSDHSMS